MLLLKYDLVFQPLDSDFAICQDETEAKEFIAAFSDEGTNWKCYHVGEEFKIN